MTTFGLKSVICSLHSNTGARLIMWMSSQGKWNLSSIWCGREDSNFHGSYPTATSTYVH